MHIRPLRGSHSTGHLLANHRIEYFFPQTYIRYPGRPSAVFGPPRSRRSNSGAVRPSVLHLRDGHPMQARGHSVLGFRRYYDHRSTHLHQVWFETVRSDSDPKHCPLACHSGHYLLSFMPIIGSPIGLSLQSLLSIVCISLCILWAKRHMTLTLTAEEPVLQNKANEHHMRAESLQENSTRHRLTTERIEQ